MKRSTKIFLGVLSFWPFAYFVLLFFFMFAMVGTAEPGEPPEFVFVIIPLHFLTFLSIFGLMVYYIVNVFLNEKLPQSKKALWAAVLFLGNMMAAPFYWYFYIWCEPKPVGEGPVVTEGGEPVIFCTSCGTKHPFNTFSCTNCGRPLHEHGAETGGGAAYETVGAIIPYRNKYALAAYYMGVFSLIPGLGIILGPAAFTTGVMGLKDVKSSPEDKGTLHAWAGIILGGLTTIGNIVLIVWLYVYIRST